MAVDLVAAELLVPLAAKMSEEPFRLVIMDGADCSEILDVQCI